MKREDEDEDKDEDDEKMKKINAAETEALKGGGRGGEGGNMRPLPWITAMVQTIKHLP